MILNTRVKILRKKLNLSQDSFGSRLGVTGAGISKIESNHRSLTEQMIRMICKEFNVNEHWLRLGQGEMFKQKGPSGIEQLSDYYQLDEFDQRIITEYALLDEKKRKVIKEYIMSIAYGSSTTDMPDQGWKDNVLRLAEDTDGEGTYHNK